MEKMNKDIVVKKNIYIILAIVLLLGIVIEATRSQFILQVSSHEANGRSAKAAVPKQNGISPQELARLTREKFLIVTDPEDSGSGEITRNVKQVLDYMKKEYETIEVTKLTKPSVSYRTILVTVENLGKFPDLDALLRYAEDGGRVFFTRTPEYNDGFYRIYRKLGVNAMGGPVVTKGIQMTSNLLIQGQEAKISEKLIFNTSIPVELEERSKVYAIAIEDRVPLLWDVDYGKGKFMVYNGTNLQSSMNRGLIAGAVSVLNPDFLYPIMNMKIMYIDDFPSPFRQGYDLDMYRAYKKDIPDFYHDIWWPDMIRLAADYDVTYTGALIQTYNDRVEQPFTDLEGSDKTNLITYGRDLLKLGGELGIHGYNHQSLVTDQSRVDELGYRAWPSEASMTQSLQELDAYIKRIFSQYAIRVYVPPSNVMAEEGRQALKNTFPQVNIIASLYAESANNLEYIQEFSVAGDGIVEMPRITSGYADTDINDWYIANAMTSLGVFSHFVHPDDILDKARSKAKTWPSLSKEIRSMMKKLYERYPWMRSMTASEGGSELTDYLQTRVYVEHSEDKITGYMNNFSEEMFFVLRTDKKMTSTQGCSVEWIDEGVYLVHATKAKFEIGLKG